MKNKLIILTFGFLFFSCNKSFYDGQKEITKVGEDANRLLLPSMTFYDLYSLELWMRYNFDYPTSYIISRYGKPISIVYDTVRNRHDNSLDSTITLNYSGAEISSYHVIDGNRYLIISVTLNESYLFPYIGLRYKMSRESFERLIKRPCVSERQKNKNETVLRYQINLYDAESYFDFTFRNNRLIKIDYLPYLD